MSSRFHACSRQPAVVDRQLSSEEVVEVSEMASRPSPAPSRSGLSAWSHMNAIGRSPLRFTWHLRRRLAPDGRSAAIHPMTAERIRRQNVTATDDFDDEVKRAAAAVAADRCSNPDCRALTSGPTNDRRKSLTLGVAVAISAMAPGGRRYDARLSDAERHDERNAVVMLQLRRSGGQRRRSLSSRALAVLEAEAELRSPW